MDLSESQSCRNQIFFAKSNMIVAVKDVCRFTTIATTLCYKSMHTHTHTRTRKPHQRSGQEFDDWSAPGSIRTCECLGWSMMLNSSCFPSVHTADSMEGASLMPVSPLAVVDVALPTYETKTLGGSAVVLGKHMSQSALLNLKSNGSQTLGHPTLRSLQHKTPTALSRTKSNTIFK